MTASTVQFSCDSESLLRGFDPLERVISIDDFDSGQHGWAAYFPDYDGWDDYPGRYPHVEHLSRILRRTSDGTIDDRVDRRFPTGARSIPQLSQITSGGLGSRSGGRWVLKVPTLPQAGFKAVAKKRLADPWNARFRVEALLSVGSDSDGEEAETAVRAVTLSHDVHDPWRVTENGRQPRRWWPGVRYVQADGNGHVGCWQIMANGTWGTIDGPWTNLADARGALRCAGRSDAPSWHYLRLTYDLGAYTYSDFRFDDVEYEVAGRTHVFEPPLTGWRASTDKAHGLVFPTFGIESNTDRRCYLWLKSIVFSASEE